MACWVFLCREVEVTWFLPASKNDQAALGYSRRLRCSCSSHAKSRGELAKCIVHVLLGHMHFLKFRFASRWGKDGPSWDLPLFPDNSGSVVAKAAMVESIRRASAHLGVPDSSPDGSERVTGHSLRVSGAQGLIRLGWHPWAVQLQGRLGERRGETLKP